MAKILAACLNCEHGPTVEPCGKCDSCVAIANATSLDVIEMDAASNNSVDDIRDLRESVAYAPVSGRHKVYILDEAHMLSSQAWNAFLKTLEEPPPHTIFVLATTEAQKVLPTVVDRCHRFDFGRPTVEDLATVITRVAGQEDIEIAPDAVALLARHATGSFRDALGTLEQLVTYSGREVATEDVLAVLGVADADLLFAALEAVGAHDARAALVAAASLASSGRDLGQVMRDLESHARELLIVQTLGEVPSELHITPDRDARLAEQAGRVGRADLVRFLELLADAMKAVKDGAEARTRVELALIEAASPQVDPSARALMARLDEVTWPKPLDELLEAALTTYRRGAPWVEDARLSPKSVARDMFERSLTFVEYVGFYQLARSEGLVLRYLADTYRTLRQTVPDEAKTEELADIEAWLGELVRQVDSSLLDEWEALAAGEGGGDSAPPPLDEIPDAVTRNVRAFRVLVRNALFRRVELAALRRWDLLGELDGEAGWDADAWRTALLPYFAEYGDTFTAIGTGPAARGPGLVTITEEPERWLVRQVFDDPAGDRDWAITAEVDLTASDEEGVAVVWVTDVAPAP